MKKSRFILSLFCILFLGELVAQTTFQPRQLNPQFKGIVYDKELTFDFTIHSNGFAIGANFGKIKTYYKTKYYMIQIGELHHPKEERQSFDWGGSVNGASSSKSFFFGKRNNLYVVRAGMGMKKYYSEKAKHKGVAIGFNYEAGPSLGLLKPYYLEILYPTDNNTQYVLRSEKYSEGNASSFLDFNSIYGSTGFTKGFGELKPIVGAHAKFGVHFDWGAFDEFVKAIEAGVMLDLYLKKVPLMVENETLTNVENRPFFVNLYLTLQLGKRK